MKCGKVERARRVCEIIIGDKYYATSAEMSNVYKNVEASLRRVLINGIVTRRATLQQDLRLYCAIVTIAFRRWLSPHNLLKDLMAE